MTITAIIATATTAPAVMPPISQPAPPPLRLEVAVTVALARPARQTRRRPARRPARHLPGLLAAAHEHHVRARAVAAGGPAHRAERGLRVAGLDRRRLHRHVVGRGGQRGLRRRRPAGGGLVVRSHSVEGATAAWTVVDATAAWTVVDATAAWTVVDATAAWTAVACTAASPPLDAIPLPGVTSGCVWWVHVDPSHQRSRPGVPYGSGYQPEGGKSMGQG